jgi:hypothetical protein
MITVGLVKELLFISTALNVEVSAVMSFPKVIEHPQLTLFVHNNILKVVVEANGIKEAMWQEEIEGPSAMFGVESCDQISRIIHAISKGDIKTAQKLYYFDSPDKNIDSPTKLL